MARVGTRTGLMHHLLTLNVPSYAADAAGQMKPTQSRAEPAWGKIEPAGSIENVVDGTVEAVAGYKITIRYDSAIDAIDESWWITYGARRFNIVSVFKGSLRNQWIELQCRESKT